MQYDQSFKSRYAGTKGMLLFRDKLRKAAEKYPISEHYSSIWCLYQVVLCVLVVYKKMKNVFEILLKTKSFSSSNTFAPQELPFGISEPEDMEI